ncbi:MAG: dihydroneopterin aldolase [Hellea sp.]
MLKVYENDSHTSLKPLKSAINDQVFIEGLVLQAQIGVFDNERGIEQPVRFDISVDLGHLDNTLSDSAQNILRYDYIVEDVKKLLAKGHIDLVETLAESVAQICLFYDRAEQATVSVSKLNAFEEAEAVGVRITRFRDA